MGAARPRRIRHQGHHGDAGTAEIVDRLTHRRVIERDHGDAVDGAVQAVERRRQDVAVEDIDEGDADLDPLAGDEVGSGAHLVLELLHEDVGADRQEEPETVDPSPGKTCCEPVGPVLQPVDCGLHALDGLDMDARTAIEHPVDRGEADTRRARHVQERGSRQMTCLPQTMLIAAVKGRQFP